MTTKQLEDAFIERERKNGFPMTWESEMMMRYAYSEGARESGQIAYRDGVDDQRNRVLAALGAVRSAAYRGQL